MINSPPLIWVKSLFRKFFPEIIGIGCLSLIWLLEPFRHFIFFKDYGIIWEAAYRMYLGQIPFIDFSTPVGPGSFLIPALFFKLIGPSWHSLHLAQLFQNCIFLFSAYYILNRNGLNRIEVCLSIILFTFLYLVFLSHPWYNSTATLFFFISLALTLTQSRFSLFTAGLFSGLSFLTKQDIGIVCLFAICLISFQKTNSSRLIKNKFLCPIECMLGMLTVIFLFATLIGFDHFDIWIKRAFSLALQRGNNWGDILSGLPIFILGILCLKDFILKKERFLLYAAALYIAAFVGLQTKSLFFTNYYYVLFIIPTFTYYAKRNIRYALFILAPLLLLSALSPLSSLRNLSITTLLAMPEPFRLKHSLVTKSVEYPPQRIKSFKHTLVPPETIQAIDLIREKALDISLQYKRRPSLLNVSELTPIYYEINADPPKNISLWFDPKLQIPRTEVDLLIQKINKSEFDIIIFQRTYAAESSSGFIKYDFYEKLFALINSNKNYHLTLEDGYHSPSGSLYGCADKKDCIDHMLFVFFRTEDQRTD